ncbi:MAG: hypothetical protein Q8L68_01795 [Methylococcales bacterium]|nr:hypothetical protein [Methylococcales bacterium]
MASGGVTSRNTRQGFRSEYIVKYIFSAFGTAVDVSAENDLGIDLLCNLTTFEGKLITYKSTYGIQVKSKGTPFRYVGKQATTWLSKLEFPLLLVEVDKPNSKIKVFSTWNLNKYLLGFHTDNEVSFPDEIVFLTADDGKLNPPDCQTGSIPVGKPILDFEFGDIDDQKNCDLFYQVLSEWLDFDNENYKLRRAGISRTYGFVNWTTNQKLSDGAGWDLLYYYSPFHHKKINELLKHALIVQGLFCKESSNGGTIESFKNEFNDLQTYVDKHLKAEMDDFGKDIFTAAI